MYEIKDLLEKGSGKDKAVFYCLQYLDRKTLHLPPVVTEEEAEVLESSVTQEQRKEFDKWVGYYHTLTRVAPVFGHTYSEFKGEANRLLSFIQIWEDYTVEEAHLNAIISKLKEKGCNDSVELLHKVVNLLSLDYGRFTRTKDDYVSIDFGTGNFWSIIDAQRRDVETAYSMFKSAVVVLEDWIKKHRCKAIVPDELRRAIENGKEDYALYVAPLYSRTELLKRMRKGEEIPLYEQQRAIFPAYEEIPITEMYSNIIKSKLQ